jgi:hypothetical protein
MAEALKSSVRAEIEPARSCLNCGEELTGKFCSCCGQEDGELHPTVRGLALDLLGEIFSFDTRFLRTLRPLLVRPGELTQAYLAGHRIRFIAPLKTYLLASVLFFGLLALIPSANVSVVSQGPLGAPKPAAAPPEGGTQVSFTLPEHYPFFDRQFQVASARAKAHPRAFGAAVFDSLPRVFFLLLPAFALFLRLFYRQGWHYLDHLVFALHYHAFVFLDLTALVVLGRPWVPSGVAWGLGLLCVLGLLVYLPIALRRVYGGSRGTTFLKLLGLGALYFTAFVSCLGVLVLTTLWRF